MHSRNDDTGGHRLNLVPMLGVIQGHKQRQKQKLRQRQWPGQYKTGGAVRLSKHVSASQACCFFFQLVYGAMYYTICAGSC